MRAAICWASSRGNTEAIRAAVPDIIGADIDVPLEYPYVLPFKVENIEDPDVYKFYSESYDLNKHFKKNTPDNIKKQMIKMLPFAAPAVLGTGAALSSEDKKKLPENRFGGNISNLQKFTR